MSIWRGPLGGPASSAVAADVPHYAASLMKLPLLVAAAELSGSLPVTDTLPSAVGGTYTMRAADDPDPLVWTWLGSSAPVRWLAERMIVRSSNLAANLLLHAVGVDAVNAVWQRAGARHSSTRRGIDDVAARAAGLTNVVTAADVAALLTLIAGHPALLGVLLRQERTEDFADVLPAGTRIAHKNAWVRGVRHCAAIVYPVDTPAYVLVALTSTGRPDAEARAMLQAVAAAG